MKAASTIDARSHISVCVCTYRRPAPLTRLLDALRDQATGGLFTYSIIIVDNDAAQSAKTAASAAAEHLSLVYAVERAQRIALARNKCVEHATGDLVAFIDDDEVPPPRWLLTLFESLNASGVDGVLGPICAQFDEEPPQWIIDGGFYDRPRHSTGLRLGWQQCRTGNVLLRRQMFVDNPQPFRPEFRSGEDQDFFRRMIDQGRTFAWCDAAAVHEVVPPARWKRSALIRRAMFRGVFSQCARGSSMNAFARSLVAAPVYAAVLPVAMVFGHARFMSAAYKCSYHTGRLLAFAGIDPIKQPYVTDDVS